MTMPGAMLIEKSTSEICQFLVMSLVSWSSKKQTFVTLSTVEAEYVAVDQCCVQLLQTLNPKLATCWEKQSVQATDEKKTASARECLCGKRRGCVAPSQGRNSKVPVGGFGAGCRDGTTHQSSRQSSRRPYIQSTYIHVLGAAR
jgi:hypothetical protein